MKVLKERLKSILLITLIISSLVLTQINLFDGLMISEGISDDVDISSTRLSTYINPQSYFVSFGGLSYTRVYDFKLQDNIWGEIRPFILSCFINYESVQEIKRDEYIKAFSDRSLLVRMPLDLSASQYYSIFSDEVLDDDIKKITPKEYLLREGNVRSLYVFDAESDKYYLIKHKNVMHDIASLIDAVKAEEQIEYRKISVRFSLDSTVSEAYNQLNYELIPYQDYSITPSIRIENEVSLDEEQFGRDVSSISSSVFGSRLDFVKRLKDINDSIILMYGYGDKSLTVTHDGLISYRKKFDATKSKILNFKEAFALATGKIENFGLLPEGLFLAEYVEDKTTNTFSFYFNYKLNSLSIAESFSSDYPIVVVVRENQVVSVDKNMKIFAGEMVDSRYSNIERLFTIDECITNNFLEMSVYYLQDNDIYNSEVDPFEYYYPIWSEISSIDLRYLIEESDITVSIASETYMIPAWQVVISDRTYLFNAYSGKLVKTYR